jgi:hypothetical protein
MVDFKKLRAGKAKPSPVNPREIFHSLPKPIGINDLYASQAEVLDNWYGRRHDKDVVVKLHTGGGKTLVALLMAQSVMNIHRYRRLLDTRLSEIEREFIARRLSEEEVAANRLIDSTFPVNLQHHMTPTPTSLVAAVHHWSNCWKSSLIQPTAGSRK